MRTRYAGTLVLLTVLTACADELISGPGNIGGDFEVDAGPGIQPAYAWSAGPAFTIVVVRTAEPTVVVWRVADPNNNDIRSPLTHGTTPAGTFETVSRERTLTRGIEYRVTVTLPDGRNGFREFKP